MKTRSSKVAILKKPLDKWNKDNRATWEDPKIAYFYREDDEEGLLLINKLKSILSKYGECVAISNSLVLEIIRGYIRKSTKLKKAEERNAALENEVLRLNNELVEMEAKISKLSEDLACSEDDT